MYFGNKKRALGKQWMRDFREKGAAMGNQHFQTLMKDHDIENIVKIDKIDRADTIDINQKVTIENYRFIDCFSNIGFLSIAPVGIISDWHSFKGLTDTQQHTVTQSMV